MKFRSMLPFLLLATIIASQVVVQSAMAQRTPYGRPLSTTTSGTYVATSRVIATTTVLAAIPATDARRTAGYIVTLASGAQYQFHATSTAADTTSEVVVTPGAGSGRWLRLPGAIDISTVAVTFASADDAVVFTVPVGARVRVARGYMVNTVAWTGGTDAGIGFASSQSPHNVDGDLHGGSAGELTAAAGTGAKEGTVGTDIAAGVILEAAATVTYNRVASQYDAGAGVLHLVCDLLANPGA